MKKKKKQNEKHTLTRAETDTHFSVSIADIWELCQLEVGKVCKN